MERKSKHPPVPGEGATQRRAPVFPFSFSLSCSRRAASDWYRCYIPRKETLNKCLLGTQLGNHGHPLGFRHAVSGWSTQRWRGEGRRGAGALPKRLQAATAPSQPRNPESSWPGSQSPSPREQTHLVSEVHHNEGRVGHAGFLEVLAAGVPVIQLLSPVLVGSFRDLWNHKTRCFVKRKRKPRADARGRHRQ